ncbi:MAG: hypothetical protein AB1589_35065 [Cyanobacteriota bacterium]
MQRVFSLLTPTATAAGILITGVIPAQSQELALTSMFNSVVVQRAPTSFNQQLKSAPPPVDGRPDDERTPAGTRLAQPPVVLPEEAL